MQLGPPTSSQDRDDTGVACQSIKRACAIAVPRSTDSRREKCWAWNKKKKNASHPSPECVFFFNVKRERHCGILHDAMPQYTKEMSRYALVCAIVVPRSTRQQSEIMPGIKQPNHGREHLISRRIAIFFSRLMENVTDAAVCYTALVLFASCYSKGSNHAPNQSKQSRYTILHNTSQSLWIEASLLRAVGVRFCFQSTFYCI